MINFHEAKSHSRFNTQETILKSHKRRINTCGMESFFFFHYSNGPITRDAPPLNSNDKARLITMASARQSSHARVYSPLVRYSQMDPWIAKRMVGHQQ